MASVSVIMAEDRIEARSDEALLAAYGRRGSRAALEELVRRHFAPAFRFALRALGDPAAAEDAAADALVRLVRAAPRFEPGRRFGPWWGALLVHAVRDVARARRRRARREERAAARRPEAVGGADGAVRLEQGELAAHVERLPLDVRVAIILHFYEGRSHDEVAAILGCPKGTAASRIRRGIERLRDALGRAGYAGVGVGDVAAWLAREMDAAVAGGGGAAGTGGPVPEPPGAAALEVRAAHADAAIARRASAIEAPPAPARGAAPEGEVPPAPAPSAPVSAAPPPGPAPEPASAALAPAPVATPAAEPHLAVRLLDARDGRPLRDLELVFEAAAADPPLRLEGTSGEDGRVAFLPSGATAVAAPRTRLEASLVLGDDARRRTLAGIDLTALASADRVDLDLRLELPLVQRPVTGKDLRVRLVCDATGAALARTKVHLDDGRSAPEWPPRRTDARGEVVFRELEEGKARLRVFADDVGGLAAQGRRVLFPRYPEIELDVGARALADGIVVRALRSGIVSGRVLDPLGQPVAGAAVAFCATGGDVTGVFARATAGEDGGFRVAVGPGEYVAVATTPEWGTAEVRTVAVAEGPAPAPVEIVFGVPGRLTGFVLSEDGEPLPGAALEIVPRLSRLPPPPEFGPPDDPSDGRRVEARAGADGCFEVALAPGEFEAIAGAPRFAGERRRATVRAGEATRVEFRLGRGETIAGRLIEKGGRLLAGGATLLLRANALEARERSIDVPESAAGRFEVGGLLAGARYDLRFILHDGAHRGDIVGAGVRPGTTDLVIEIPPAARIAGRLLFPRGGPRARAVRYMVFAGAGYSSASVPVGENGRVALALDPRACERIVLLVPGYASFAIERQKLAGGEVKDVTVRLEPEAAIEGRVLDEAGAPLGGVGVRVVEPGWWDGSARTDADGRFRIGSCGTGEASLQVDGGPEFEWRKVAVQTRAGEAAAVAVTLQRKRD